MRTSTRQRCRLVPTRHRSSHTPRHTTSFHSPAAHRDRSHLLLLLSRRPVLHTIRPALAARQARRHRVAQLTRGPARFIDQVLLLDPQGFISRLVQRPTPQHGLLDSAKVCSSRSSGVCVCIELNFFSRCAVSPYAQMNRSTSEVGHLPVYHGSLDLGQTLRNGYYNSAEDLTVGGGPPLRTRTPLANTQHPPPHAQQQQTPQQRHSPSLHGRSLPAGPAHIPVPSTSRPRDALQKTSSSGSSRSDAHMPPPGVDYEDLDLVRRDPFAARDQLHQRMASSCKSCSSCRPVCLPFRG